MICLKCIRLVAAAALALLVTIVPIVAAAQSQPDDMARLLAGLQPSPGSPAEAAAREPGWQRHARAMDATWARLEARQLSRIRAWSAVNAQPARTTVLYMFSGPDFLYANAFFGSADTYVLAGLEPIGRVPQLTPAMLASPGPALGGLRASLSALLRFSFFITRDMKHDLRARSLSGTLPLLYVFLARSGKTVVSAELVELDQEGRLLAAQAGDRDPFKGPAAGVEITFSGPDGRTRKLYYFRTDLSDGGIEASGFAAFVRRFGRADSLIKSASYLLHAGNFSRARKLLLEQSDRIVQDDSGVPVSNFSQGEWALRPFGRYLGPIGEFPGRYQVRLAHLYGRSAGRLDFGIGYRWRRAESNLLLAVRNGALQASSGMGAPPR